MTNDTKGFILSESLNDFNNFNLERMCFSFQEYKAEFIVIGQTSTAYTQYYKDYKNSSSLPKYKDFLIALKDLQNINLSDEYPEYCI